MEYKKSFSVQNCTYVKGHYHCKNIYSQKHIFDPPVIISNILIMKIFASIMCQGHGLEYDINNRLEYKLNIIFEYI